MSGKWTERTEKDNRINTRHFSVSGFVLIYMVLAVLTFSQTLIFNAFLHKQVFPSGYILGMMGYWAITAFIFCLVIERRRYLDYDRPMIIISRAAKKVAAGDYTVRISPLRKDGKKDYVEVMIEDFNRMTEELASTEILKSDFIANVSHEIKTPLSVIQSYASALQNPDLSAEKKNDYTDTIMEASKKLSTLVTNILKLSKLENQEILPSAQPYNLSRQLIDCALSFEELWEQKNIEFIADVEDWAIVNADESVLEIVWNNLLSNAVKFTEPGGTIKLTQTQTAEEVGVTVEDSGPGMNRETVNKIFDKFFQGDTSHSQEGNGLGLALSRKVIELVDGEISVESKLGQGTAFTVKLKAMK